MIGPNPSTDAGSEVVARAIGGHWKLFLIEGIVLVILGAAAIVLPQIASLAVAIMLGWLFLIGGGIGLATTVMARMAPGFWWALASSVVSIAVGALLLGWPIHAVVSLTFLLTVFLIADGLFMIMYGIEHRRQLSQRWGWLTANGVLDLVLAAIIIVALPGSALWVLGLVIGIDLLFGGSSLIAIALKARPS
jgi:uncharacterized membrane protein HdeD (DUF308 family)